MQTLSSVCWPVSTQKFWSTQFGRSATLVLVGVGLLAVSAKVYIPFYPVPMSLQTMLVVLLGTAYGFRLGACTMLAYLALGALGVPVFASPVAGLQVLFGPTGGYLLGFLVAGSACGLLADRGYGKTFLSMLGILVVANICIYTFGLLVLGEFIGWGKPVLEFGLYPFILGDLLKMALAGLLVPSIWKMLNHGSK